MKKLFLTFLILLALSGVAWDASVIIYPESDITTNQWTPGGTSPCGAAAHYDCVNEVTANDGVDYLSAVIANYIDRWVLQDNVIYADSTIDSVLITSRGYGDEYFEDYSGWQSQIRIGSDVTSGAIHSVAIWTTFTEKLACPGGRSWTPARVDSLQGSINLIYLAGVGIDVYVTQYYATVYYHYTTGAGEIELLRKVQQRK